MGEALTSYAADINLNNQDNNTNVENVKFDIYFDVTDKSKKEIEEDINTEGLKLFVSVDVKDGGYLSGGQIEFTNCNFKLKNNQDKIELDSIQSGQSKEYLVEIVAKKDDSFNLNLLEMISQIKLDAEYINNEGNGVHVESTKNVKISWIANIVSDDDEIVKLNQEVITSKIYRVGGQDKRVIQLLVKSGIENNQYPIKSSELEVIVPKLGELYPEKVIVASYDTIATNGKNSTEFEKIIVGTEQTKLGNWIYNESEHKVNITINNDPVENKISWEKSGEDTFVITYVYDKNVNEANFTSIINSKISLYETQNKVLEETSEITKETMEAMGDAITLNVLGTNTIYKSNMNLNQETEFNTKWTVQVGYADISTESLAIGNYEEILVVGENNIVANAYYKTTYINKEEFLKILGQDGQLLLASEDTTIPEKYIIIGIVDKDSIADENGNICINYPEDKKISKLNILTTNTVSEGKLNITHTKMLDTSTLSKEQIALINKLTTDASLFVDLPEEQEETAIVEITKTADIDIQEPKAEVNIAIDKEKLSTTQKNNVNLTVTLKQDSLKYKLYKNPVIEIELPKEVESIKVGEPTILNEAQTGLKIINKEELQNSNGNKVIKITLEGEQTEYIGQDVQILVNLDLQTTKLMPTVEKFITVSCMNQEETIQNSCSVFFKAEQGILLANSIANYNNEEPEINVFKNETKTGLLSLDLEEVIATGELAVINNTEENLENVIVIGKNVAQINSEIDNANVYYTKDTEVTLESDWIQEYSEDITGYKIVLNSLEIGEVVEIPYNLNVTKQLGTDDSMEISYSVYKGTDKLEESPKILLQIAQEVKLALEVETAISNGETIFEGNILSYNIKVTNIGDCIARNIKINNPVPEGTTLNKDNNSWIVDELMVGDSIIKTIQVKVNTLPEGETLKTITNITTVTAPYLKEELKSTISNIVKKAIVKVDIVDGYNDGGSIYENGQAFYKAIVTNASEVDLNNVVITSYIPENTTIVVDGVEANDVNVITKKEQSKIIYEIDKLEKGKTVIIKTKLAVGEVLDNQNNISYKIEIDSDEMELYTTEKTDEIAKPKLHLEFNSKNKTDIKRDTVVNKGDVLEYSAKITNLGNKNENILIEGKFSNALICDSIKYIVDGQEEVQVKTRSGEYSIYLELPKNESVTISMIATVADIIAEKSDIIILNKISCAAQIYDRDGFGKEMYASRSDETIEYIIKAENMEPENPNDPQDPTNPEKPEDPENPNDPQNPTHKSYKISGLAWLDENENGKKEEAEKLLKEIKVKIKNAKTNEYLKGENGEYITVTTNEKGQYEFNNLKAGKYIVEFEYNNNTYRVTPVKGKDSVANTVTTGKDTVITTEVIRITNKNISNINIGLCLNPIYDLKLDKYITKVTVQNSAGTKVYNYNKEQLAKVEIKSKNMAGSIVIVEYTIEVTNNGAVPGYAKTIADYLSPELKFNSELNTSWYQGTDNNLYCVELANDAIQPGESKQVKLILTKTMTANNTGLVNNTAEIYEEFNDYALEDINSIVGNKEEKENDMSGADLIITVSTGSPILYIGIVIGSMLILGIGIYLINKKVIMRRYI